MNESGIAFDAIMGDDDHIGMVPLTTSEYSVENLDGAEVVAIQSPIDISELVLMVEYINSHEGRYKVSLFKTSELPEYSELLYKEKADGLPREIQEVLMTYIRRLLDQTDGERMRTIMEYEEHESFGKLLRYYSEPVREFILSHSSKRYELALRKELEG